MSCSHPTPGRPRRQTFPRAGWPCLALLLLLIGCTSTLDGRRGLPPLFEYSPTPAAETHWTLSPLITFDRSDNFAEVTVLWPLFRTTRKGESTRSWLMPLWYWMNFVHSPGHVDRDRMIFPFFWGSDREEGSYLLMAPLFGRLKGIFGQDRIDMLLFPLYVTLVDRERVSTHVFFPFVNWVRGPTRSGWRFFPFYGHYTAQTAEGVKKYDRRFYLWPLFHFQENNLDTARPMQARWFWPFYGRIQGENLVRHSILWPWIGWQRTQNPDSFTLTCFPLKISNGEHHWQRDFWPIYGVKKTDRLDRHFFLWPLYSWQRLTLKDQEEEHQWILPFYWRYRLKDNKTGTEKKSLRLWPLYSWRKSAAGRRELNLLDILPFDDPEHFGRLYGRLWRIFRWVDDEASGEGGWELLWGLLKGERRASHRRFSLLGGLLEREVTNGAARWRIFYIPL